MTEPKFTPGVWRKHSLEDGHGVAFVVVDDDDIICALANHADAHLFAAAKELYAACEALTRNAEAYASAFRESSALREIWGTLAKEGKAALAKARGDRHSQKIGLAPDRILG